ncbi:hypothetical protein PG993_013380 [Apiospora rasikravindrae]|uniref:F-box domain-containing protein n=1 Tax=Apiospora rasikravindrae TaxID=990691 RepID=A0ABR1RXZ4_9PEZI
MAENNNIVQQPHGNQINDDTAKESNKMVVHTTHLVGDSTEQSPPGYLCLPNELVLEIFSYLPQETRHQLRLVNRATRNILPPQRMVFRKSDQAALFEAVASALKSSPDSVKDLNLTQLAIVLFGYVAFEEQASPQARRAVRVVMERATHLERFCLGGPADLNDPQWLAISWEGYRAPSGEVVVEEKLTPCWQKEPQWYHVSF